MSDSSSTPPFARRPPEAWEPLFRAARLAARPLDRFLAIEAASGILLLAAAAVALVLANSPWRADYAHLWHTPTGLRIGSFVFERPLEWVVNDVLMVVFFFVVGLEIRREVDHGELSEWRRALLPAGAAIGGMIAPALLFLAVAHDPATSRGWGVPMATDIAFAVGVLALLGKRVPPALRVLLLALAVIDDLGAILVIALFYSSGIQLGGFVVAGAGLAIVLVLQWAGVRSKLAYIVPGIITWGGVLTAGVHPTIAGVLLGVLTPVRAWLGPEGFVEAVRDDLELVGAGSDTHQLAKTLAHINQMRREALSPAESLIAHLHPWVAFVIMPLFALANAGVSFSDASLTEATLPIFTGIVLGLVIGKPVGVLIACSALVRLGLATLPRGLSLRHLVVLGVVAGIGFTMSIFVAQLAFEEASALGSAKLAVLAASALACVLSLVAGRVLLAAPAPDNGALSADEAESSTEL